MRYTQLRSFHAVAMAGSFTKAAAVLRVSQPTLTTQVKGMEADYQVELFLRRSTGLELTDTGRDLLQITNRLFAQEKEAELYLRESKELRTGHLRVGAVGPFHVTEMLVAFNERYPGIEVSVSIGNSRDTVRSLMEFRTDIAVLAYVDNDPKLLAWQYSKDKIAAFAHRDHPLAKRRRSIKARDLSGQLMVMRERGSNTRRAIEEMLQKTQVKPKVMMEIGSREAVREAVARGIGIGTVSTAEFIPDPRLRMLPFSDVDVFNYAHVVCLEERKGERLIGAFLGGVMELLERRGNGTRPSRTGHPKK
jgi:LysR family transcriptional regulator, low CO2-responsive transcriptional regulator